MAGGSAALSCGGPRAPPQHPRAVHTACGSTRIGLLRHRHARLHVTPAARVHAHTQIKTLMLASGGASPCVCPIPWGWPGPRSATRHAPASAGEGVCVGAPPHPLAPWHPYTKGCGMFGRSLDPPRLPSPLPLNPPLRTNIPDSLGVEVPGCQGMGWSSHPNRRW